MNTLFLVILRVFWVITSVLGDFEGVLGGC